MKLKPYHSHLGGQWVARCDTCKTVLAYWEDEEELEHKCPDEEQGEQAK